MSSSPPSVSSNTHTSHTEEYTPELDLDELLPPISRWMIRGGITLLSTFLSAFLLASILEYKVAVKVPVRLRPSGELRIVQAQVEGAIQSIEVTPNQTVEEGDIIAILQSEGFQKRKSALTTQISSIQQQLTELTIQLGLIDQQISVEESQTTQAVNIAKEQLKLNQQIYNNTQSSNAAAVDEATAALELANDEVIRFQTLSNQGVVSESQLKEKETSREIAQARLRRTQSDLNLSDASIVQAEESIAQERAKGQATIISLKQQRQELRQNKQGLETQLSNAQESLQQTELSISNSIIRAPFPGVLMELGLRNPGQLVQKGDTVSYVSPEGDTLIAKASILSKDITKVTEGNQAVLRITACPYPEFGTVKGHVILIAPDAQVTQQLSLSDSSQGVFDVTIALDQSELKSKDKNCLLQAGMEGQAEIISAKENVLQFFLRKARLLTDL